ncbi:V-Type Proton Atpase Subunit G 3 [Manis pentadactyla]|nr:V-Type Proton Atpase Subunit G 3 [Manis pentadactyla]
MAETDQYRMQREKEFRRRQSKKKQKSKWLARMKELEEHHSNHVESVVAQLLSIVCDVKSEIHMNYRATD